MLGKSKALTLSDPLMYGYETVTDLSLIDGTNQQSWFSQHNLSKSLTKLTWLKEDWFFKHKIFFVLTLWVEYTK